MIAWELKIISHGFYADTLGSIEEVSKQAAKWGEWFEKG
jgi:hypothetical protein